MICYVCILYVWQWHDKHQHHNRTRQQSFSSSFEPYWIECTSGRRVRHSPWTTASHTDTSVAVLSFHISYSMLLDLAWNIWPAASFEEGYYWQKKDTNTKTLYLKCTLVASSLTNRCYWNRKTVETSVLYCGTVSLCESSIQVMDQTATKNMTRKELRGVIIWPGPVALSVLYQVCCRLLPLTFVIC